VAVATTNPIDRLETADVAVHRLDELTVDQLASRLASNPERSHESRSDNLIAG